MLSKHAADDFNRFYTHAYWRLVKAGFKKVSLTAMFFITDDDELQVENRYEISMLKIELDLAP